MKRIAALLIALLLLLPVTLHADVAWEPPDDFLGEYIDHCDWMIPSARHYVALCDFHSYKSPLDPTFVKSISAGSELYIEWTYTDEFGHIWGLYGSYSGWVPMDAVTPAYSPEDYLKDHADSVQPYAGEIDYLLPTQKELDAIARYRAQPHGGNGGGGNAPDFAQFQHPQYTAWRYPNCALTYYYDAWSPNIHPLYTLKDKNGTTWVYAEDTRTEGYTYWIHADDPEKHPSPNAPKLPPPVQEAPTHLPVPGEENLQHIGAATYLSPVLPAILAVAGVVLLSAVLIVLLQRTKRI